MNSFFLSGSTRTSKYNLHKHRDLEETNVMSTNKSQQELSDTL